ncbi:hypothetical protein E2C01_083676 [Portunus trituberculatus]|uniref:Cadherin domain-containing protein n=1 Tax=Portunus trituberculatus TaxID=210409 RepID=A0A5B7J494_PORTR|nr:hypothetical protein [Portunus trituberculatus]
MYCCNSVWGDASSLVTCVCPQFTLRVRVSDGENAPALTDVVVAVVNVNDLQPVFQRSNYTFVVTENTDCSLPLGQPSFTRIFERHSCINFVKHADDLRKRVAGISMGAKSVRERGGEGEEEEEE